MPGEEGWISGLDPLCRLNDRRFLVPRAGLYKAQTAAGFSTLLPWNWIITKPSAIISWLPVGPALAGQWPPVVLRPRMQITPIIGRRMEGGHVWTLGVRPNPPLLCCARGGRGAPTPDLLSALRTACTAVHWSLHYLSCACCYFNYLIIFKV